jgi:hypothetical protein
VVDAITLPDIRTAHYRLALKVREELHVPRYMGSTLRGGFGHTFKRITCLQRTRETCEGCLLKHTCPYAYVFDPAPPPDAEALSTHSDVPLAFVLEPPLETRKPYVPGDRLEFGLTLVGRAIDYLPYFILVFRELGERGLGRDRARYTLQAVTALHPVDGRQAVVYRAEDELVRDQNLAASWTDLTARAGQLPTDRLTVEFLTPTRLKHDDRYHERPDFHVLVRALLRRTSSLAYFHGGQRWETDYRGWIERAEAVRTVAAHTHWVEWERYSTRQKQRTSIGGTVGRMAYEGDLAPFRPLLALGEWIHVGKACVFGNGMMRASQGSAPEAVLRGADDQALYQSNIRLRT